MKKIILALVVLMFAAPAWAKDVYITCEQVDDTNEVIVSFDADDGDPNLVRAFGLNIQLDNDANIIEVVPAMVGMCTELQQGYGIFPGTIVIDALGNVTSDGTPVGEVGDSPDTLPGLDSNGVTVEMGSLYAPVGPGSPNAPDPYGPLLSFFVSKGCTVTITANVARAGAAGVVMEDPDQAVVVNLPSTCPVIIVTDPYIGTCWSALNECAGQPQGDGNCDGLVNLGDLMALKAAWSASGPPWVDPKCCADFNHDHVVNLGDLMALKAGWGSGPHSPATGAQVCPLIP